MRHPKWRFKLLTLLAVFWDVSIGSLLTYYFLLKNTDYGLGVNIASLILSYFIFIVPPLLPLWYYKRKHQNQRNHTITTTTPHEDYAVPTTLETSTISEVTNEPPSAYSVKPLENISTSPSSPTTILKESKEAAKDLIFEDQSIKLQKQEKQIVPLFEPTKPNYEPELLNTLRLILEDEKNASITNLTERSIYSVKVSDVASDIITLETNYADFFEINR